MRKLKGILLFGGLLVALSGITSIAALQSNKQQSRKQKRAEYPIVDYNAPEISESSKRAKRRKKGEKYNNAPVPIDPSPSILTSFVNIPLPPDITALPTSRSAAVIIGTVTDAQAHLSPDKTGIYSEFDVLLEEVIKNDGNTPLKIGGTVSVERPGGRLRIPTGHIQEYMTNLNPLTVGSRYALFLIWIGDSYRVLTGYELSDKQITPLDNSTPSEQYRGVDEKTFLEDLRKTVSAPQDNNETESEITGSWVIDRPIDPEPDPNPTPDPGGGNCRLPATPPCKSPFRLPNAAPRYIPNKPVTVTYNPDHFTVEEIKAIRAGMMSWNGVQGVTFVGFTPRRDRPTVSEGNTHHFEVSSAPTDVGGNPANARTNTNSTVGPNGASTQNVTFMKQGLPLTEKAWCQNGGSIDINSYEQIVEHEAGHPFGLADTYESGENTSVMGQPSYHKIDVNPNQCDLDAVKSMYQPDPGSCPTSSTEGVYSMCGEPTPDPKPTPPGGGCTSDNDRDGVCTFDDCDDFDPNVAFDSDGDHYCYPEDCNDYDAGIHPGAFINTTEVYGEDKNCNGLDDFTEAHGGGPGGGQAPCTHYYWHYYESWDGGRTWELVDIAYAGCW